MGKPDGKPTLRVSGACLEALSGGRRVKKLDAHRSPKPIAAPPGSSPRNDVGLTRARLRGAPMSHLAPAAGRFDYRPPGLILASGSFPSSAPDRHDERHRLLVQDPRPTLRPSPGFNPCTSECPPWRNRRAAGPATGRPLQNLHFRGRPSPFRSDWDRFPHAIRRKSGCSYTSTREQRRLGGRDQGTFSASADVGSKFEKGVRESRWPESNPRVSRAFHRRDVSRSEFFRAQQQLVRSSHRIEKHRGLALVESSFHVPSPCVTFNDHEGSTRSYL